MKSFPGKDNSGEQYYALVSAEDFHNLQRMQELHAAGPRAPEKEDAIDLREYWRVLVRRRWIVFTFLGIALVGAVLGTYLSTPLYRGTLLMKIDRESEKVLEYQNVMPEEGAQTKDFYETQYELLRSRTLARRVIDQLGLKPPVDPASERSVLKDTLSSLKAWVAGSEQTAAPEKVPDAEDLFLDNLSIEPVRNSRLVRLHYVSPDPEEAAKVVNVVAENFVNMNLERRFEASAYAKTFLEERIKQVRVSLEASERRLVDYARERDIVNLDDKLDILMGRLKGMNAELGSAEAARIEAESVHLNMSENEGAAFVGVLESPVIQQLKANKQALENEYQQNLKIYKPGYPKMQQLRQQIGEVTQEIAQEVEAVRKAAEHKYEARISQEDKLRERTEQLKKQILDLQDRSSDYQTLKREVETNRELYDGLLQRMKEIDVVAGIGTNNISIIDSARVPDRPYKPSLLLNLAVALALGLFGGVLLAFLLESLDDTLKTAEEMEKSIGAPLLGIVPDVVRRSRLRARDVPLLAHVDPRSELAEAYRSIRTALIFAMSEGASKLVHVTSAGAGEGKTTAALSAGIAFAQTGSKVLLIDADMRNPSLNKVFDAANPLGLSDLLMTDSKAHEVTQPTPIENLFVITSGKLPPNPVELLASAKMLDLLAMASERFDYIIIDGPPVLGLADALVLANLAKATVFVGAVGVTRVSAIKGAIKRLRSVQANVVGGLLNKAGQIGSGYGYDYYHTYHYSYGADNYAQIALGKQSTA